MMRPVLQRRPRRGADFVLPDVPMLDSPDWSDEDEPKSKVTPPQARAAAAALARASNTPVMMYPGMIAPPVNQYFSPVGGVRVVMPPPQQLNGRRFPSPSLPRASPALEQQHWQQRIHTPQPRRVVVPGGGGGLSNHSDWHGGGYATNNFKSNAGSTGTNPLDAVESSFRSHGKTLRADKPSDLNRGADTTNDASPNKQENENEDDEDNDDNYDVRDIAGDDEDGEATNERHSPSHVAVGSFAVTTLVPGAQFAGGSFFTARQRGDDDDDDEDVSLSSVTNEQQFSDDSNSTEGSGSGREGHSRRPHNRLGDAESVGAPSYGASIGEPSRSNGTTKELRKPSLFLVSAVNSSNNHIRSNGYSLLGNNGNDNNSNNVYRTSDTSATPSVFYGLLMADDDESPVNRQGLVASTVFVGPQSVRLDRSTRQTMYTYGGGGNHTEKQPQRSQPPQHCSESESPSSDGASGAHAAVNRHGSFLMSTQDANYATAMTNSKISPGIHADIYPAFTSVGAPSPVSQLPLSIAHTPLNPAAKSASSPDLESVAARQRSPGHIAASLCNQFFEGNQLTSTDHDYNLPRDNESVVPMLSIPKPGTWLHSRCSCSGDESEEEHYEQILQSRFFQTLNSRLFLRKAPGMEVNHVSNLFASTTCRGTTVAANAEEDDVVVLPPSGGGVGRDGLSSARGARGVSAGVSASSSANPNPDRLNFRNRIVSRQAQPLSSAQQTSLAQPLFRFPPTYIATTVVAAEHSPTPSYTNVKDTNYGENSAKPSPGTAASLTSRRSLTGSNNGAESLTFSTDANLCCNATTDSAATAGKTDDCNISSTVPKASSVMSTVTTSGTGGYDGDEYGLLSWAGSPHGTRRTSMVSVEDPSGTAAAHVSSPAGHRSSVVSIPLQPALIATSRRATGSVTVVSPLERDGSAFSYSHHYSLQQQQQQHVHLVSEHRSPLSLTVSDVPSPPGVPYAPVSAAAIRCGTTDGYQRMTNDSDGAQWTSNDDVYYFQLAGYSSMVGRQASSPSATTHSQRTPSFSRYHNNDYFLNNSFRSTNTAHPPPSLPTVVPPPQQTESSGDLKALMPAFMTNGSSTAILRAGGARSGVPGSAPAPYVPQRRVSGRSNGSGICEPLSRFSPAPGPLPEAVAVVARSPRLQPTMTSGINVDTLHGLEDYKLLVNPENNNSSNTTTTTNTVNNVNFLEDYYGMDYDTNGYVYLPPVTVVSEVPVPRCAPPRHPHSPDSSRSDDSSTRRPEAQGITITTPTGKAAHRRRRLSTSSADDYMPYYYHHQLYRSRASSSSSSGTVHTKQRRSPRGPKGSAAGKSGMPPMVPSSRLVEPLHATEHAVHTEPQTSLKQDRLQNSARYTPRAASVTQNSGL